MTERFEIFRCVHGSQLYGTNMEGSDTDYKGVFVLPTLDEYLQRRGKIDVVQDKNGLLEAEKEEAELFYIQDFANLLSSMQTVCMSMVWAPRDKWITSSPAWEELVVNRHRLASKAIMPYVGYARGQSVKYTLKGERLQTLIEFMETVRAFMPLTRGNDGKLTDEQWDHLCSRYKLREGVRLWENVLPPDPISGHVPPPEPYIQVIGKSFSKYSKVANWLGPLESLYKSFGNRAKAAKDDRADLKACMHAVRIVREAKEILQTSNLVYPSPDREFYLQIRKGQISYDDIQDMMTKEIDELEQMLATSNLPDQPDREWLKHWAIKWQKACWGLA